MGDLTKNFSRKEFACRCGCGFDSIKLDLVEMLQAARKLAGIAFRITSGCRCERHNMNEGGSDTSSHLKGWAADIMVPSSMQRFIIVKALLEAGASRIEIGSGYIHVDMDPGKDKNVLSLNY
jgi:uncharacterized protein YcbK (DUF882 family)